MIIGSFRFSLLYNLPKLSFSLPPIRNRENIKSRVKPGRACNVPGRIELNNSNTGDATLPSISVKRGSGTTQDHGVGSTGSNYYDQLASFQKLPGIHDKMKHGPEPRPSGHLLKNEVPNSLPQISRNRSLMGATSNMKEEIRDERRTAMSFLPRPPSTARTTHVTQRQRLLRRRAMKDLDKY